MSLRAIIVVAGVIAGTFAINERASAQITGTSTGGYYTPGVVTTSYYTPATSWSYYGSPALYTTPYVSSYSVAPIYGYPTYPYYGGYYPRYYSGYPYYGSGVYVGGPRRWWWR
jgi:hypothetical protein